MPKPKRGRPTSFTQKKADAICERLAAGESLRGICEDDDMPDESTVRNWAIEDREGFFPQYERARIIQAHGMFDETLVIADDRQRDVVIDEKGIRTVNSEVVQRSRLRVDTRKWYISKVLPKVYGDKVHHAGYDGGPIKVTEVRHNLGDEE